MTNNSSFGKGVGGIKPLHCLSKWPRPRILVGPKVGREDVGVFSETLSSLCASHGSTLAHLHYCTHNIHNEEKPLSDKYLA